MKVGIDHAFISKRYWIIYTENITTYKVILRQIMTPQCRSSQNGCKQTWDCNSIWMDNCQCTFSAMYCLCEGNVYIWVFLSVLGDSKLFIRLYLNNIIYGISILNINPLLHASYPFISALLEKCWLWVHSFIKKEEEPRREVMQENCTQILS